MADSLPKKNGLPLSWGLFFLVSALIFWFYHFPGHPIGWDGFYYALQMEAMSEAGQLLFEDGSLVFPLLGFINGFFQDPAFTAHLTTALCYGAYAFFLWKIRQQAKRAGEVAWLSSFGAVAILALGLLNLLSLYFGLEFLKNQIALVPFFAGVYALQEKKRGSTLLGLSFLVLCLWLHKLHWVLVPLVLVYFALRYLYNRAWQQYRFKQIIFRIDLLSRLVFPFLLLLFFFFWPGSQQSFFIILQSPISLWERLSIFTLQYGLPLLTAGLALAFRRNINEKESSQGMTLFWFGIALAFSLPILGMDFNQLSFRLLILSPLFYTAGFLSLQKKNPRKVPRRKVWGPLFILFLAGGSFTLGFDYHENKYPDYPKLAHDFATLPEYTQGRPVIVHRGLASLLWYEFTQRAENFVPPHQRRDYLRLVRSLSYDVFQNLQDAPPAPLWGEWGLHPY
jgi:hypothetical protein